MGINALLCHYRPQCVVLGHAERFLVVDEGDRGRELKFLRTFEELTRGANRLAAVRPEDSGYQQRAPFEALIQTVDEWKISGTVDGDNEDSDGGVSHDSSTQSRAAK
ncbi:unnamed protein product [Soboliphyme baturini]|uniref:ABC transporter ATP-binding protein n=1 Tax=Soboliphyme baturini TaxID=241478 RepID=A0A183IIU0_9BILA|nr:unnamed protein product [Soboliphyme baturini]